MSGSITPTDAMFRGPGGSTRQLSGRFPILSSQVLDICCKCTIPESYVVAILMEFVRMLAVMTMNVGYFLSVLGGVFLGSFVVGRWTGAAVH